MLIYGYSGKLERVHPLLLVLIYYLSLYEPSIIKLQCKKSSSYLADKRKNTRFSCKLKYNSGFRTAIRFPTVNSR